MKFSSERRVVVDDDDHAVLDIEAHMEGRYLTAILHKGSELRRVRAISTQVEDGGATVQRWRVVEIFPAPNAEDWAEVEHAIAEALQAYGIINGFYAGPHIQVRFCLRA